MFYSNLSYDRDDDDLVYDNMEDPMFEDIEFADPGSGSALRAAGPDNPRNLPCPTCGQPNRLTPADVALHYQCDTCADRAERGMD